MFLFFDNLKSLLGSVVSFEEQSRSQGLSVEEIDEVVDRLKVAADTLQLLITDIDGNDAFADVTVNLNTTVNKVRRLSNIFTTIQEQHLCISLGKFLYLSIHFNGEPSRSPALCYWGRANSISKRIALLLDKDCKSSWSKRKYP